MTTAEKLGKNIRKVRELRDFDQHYLASQLGISQSQYSKIEKGIKEISLSLLERIATVLQVDRGVLEDFDADTLLNTGSHKQPAFAENKKTSMEMLVTITGECCEISPLPVMYYYAQ